MSLNHLLPTADGNYTQLTASAGNRYQCVDDPVNLPDEDTTYISQGTPAPRSGSFTVPAFGGSQSGIKSVTVTARCKDSGAGNVRLFLRISSVDYTGDAQATSAGYLDYTQEWTTNPATGLEWTNADLAALEIGVTGLTTSLLRVTQIYATVDYGFIGSIDQAAKIEGSLQNGGWRADGAILNNADLLELHQQIALWVDCHLGGAWENLPRTAFRGHVILDPWLKSFQGSDAPWTAFTAQEFLKQGEVQGIFYKHVASSPANRHQIINMSYAKIVYELIGGHCNLMDQSEAVNYDSQLWSGAFTTQTWLDGFMFLDLDLTNSSAVTEYQMKAGNMWQRINEMADIDFYVCYVDRFNRLHFKQHAMFDTTLPDPVITLTSAHLLAPLKFEKRNTEAVGQVKLHGFTPAGVQISGKYPTNPTAGPIVSKSNYLATSNAQMTAIATRMYKFENRDYTVTAQLPNAVGLLLDLLDRVAITYSSAADGVSWTSKKFWVHQIAVDIMDGFNAQTTLTLEAEAS